MKPGTSWDGIREFLSTRHDEGFSLKRKQPASAEVAKRRRVEAAENLREAQAKIADDIAPNEQAFSD